MDAIENEEQVIHERTIETPQKNEKNNKSSKPVISQVDTTLDIAFQPLNELMKKKDKTMTELVQDTYLDKILNHQNTYGDPINGVVLSLTQYLSKLIPKKDFQLVGVSMEEGSQQPKIDLFSHLIDIKKQNIEEKELYPQLNWTKEQPRLLSIVDFRDGTFNMAILHPKSKQVKSSKDFKATQLNFNMNEMHVLDKVDLHRKMGEMVSKDLIQSTTSLNKLQVQLEKVQKQLRIQRIKNRERQTKINDLEQMIIKLGYNPNDPEPIKSLLTDK